MGKPVMMRQASGKITKNGEKKQQGMMSSSSLMKVLRPRVYITDVSNFKRLVQELTGNGNPPQPIPDAQSPQCAPPHSTTTTTTFTLSSDVVLRSEEESRVLGEFEEVLGGEDTVSGYLVPMFEPSCHLQQIQMYGQQADNDEMLTFGDIETWLLEMDSAPFCESYMPEVSIYDYITGDL